MRYFTGHRRQNTSERMGVPYQMKKFLNFRVEYIMTLRQSERERDAPERFLFRSRATNNQLIVLHLFQEKIICIYYYYFFFKGGLYYRDIYSILGYYVEFDPKDNKS